VYEVRFAEGRKERLPSLVAELVRLKVDVLRRGGRRRWRQRRQRRPFDRPRARRGRRCGGRADREPRAPGGNVTGLTDESVQLSAKRMELLKEAVPRRRGSLSSATRMIRG